MATILIKKRDTTGAPVAGDLTNSASGVELAVNTADKKIYSKNSSGSVVVVGSSLDSPLEVVGNSSAGSEIRLPEDTDNGSNYVALKAANSIASNVTFTLPSADGTNGQVLQTNGSGVLSFSTPASGAVSSVSGSGSGISVSPTTGAVVIQNTGVTSFNGQTGSVVPQSSDYSSFYYSSSNPSSYTSLSTVTSTANTFSSNQTINTGGTSILYFGSGSSQGIQWTGSLLQFGLLSGTYMQIQSGQFLTNTDNVYKPTAGSWLGYSDQRIKENIVDYTKGLAAIKTLRPVNYNFKGKLGEQTNYKTYAGLIAQEVEQTPLANMIGDGPNGYKSLDSSELTYTLINAVKELSAQVDALKAEVAALK